MLSCSARVPEAQFGAPLQLNVQAPNRAVKVVTEAEERYLISTYEERVRELAAKACYPELLYGPLANEEKPIYSCSRATSGLIARVVRQDSLLPQQQQQLAEFRFHQYVLWHWFDTKTVIAQQTQTDPAFSSLPSTTLHGYVGTADGHIRAYFVVQPAVDRTGEHNVFRQLVRVVVPHTHRLGELDRPLFPAEWESFGPAVFASLLALQRTPIQHVQELNTLMRNQAHPDALTTIAVVEAVYTICQLLIMPDREIRALIGCINQDARGLLAKLGIPILYSSTAPVTRDNLPSYWSRNMNDSGKFWPFVVSVPDFLGKPEYLWNFNDVLESSPQQILQALGQLRPSGHYIVPTTARQTESTPPYDWSDDPFQQSSPAATVIGPVALTPAGADLVRLPPRPGQPLGVPSITPAARSE